MRLTKRLAAVCAATTLTVVSATSAWADDLDNGLDLGVDVTHETMTLQYDDTNSIAGANGTTSLTLIAVSGDGFNGPDCNLPGGVSLTLIPQYSTSGVVDVQLANSGVVQDCGVPLAVTVQPLHSGFTTVTFTGVLSNNANAAQNHFDYSGATFDVTVNNVDLSNGGGGSTGCDVDPAAPAWAAAILQASNVKANSVGYKNAISAVAQHMSPTASFDGVQKDGQFTEQGADYSYANAVRTYLQTLMPNKPLVSVETAKRPGWVCAGI